MISALCLARGGELTATEVLHTVLPHPTYGEIMKGAFEAAFGGPSTCNGQLTAKPASSAHRRSGAPSRTDETADRPGAAPAIRPGSKRDCRRERRF